MQSESRTVVGAILLLVLLLSGWSPLYAQATDASIAGQVRSATEEPLQNATVVVRNAATGFEARRATGENGRFSFPQLPLGGPYSVTADQVGYRTETKSGIELNLGDRVGIDFELEVAAVTLDALVVSAERGNTRVERAGASTQINQAEVRALPAADRDFTDLANLSPSFGRALSIGGQRRTSTDVRIDGAQMRDMRAGGERGSGPFTLSMEAIREFEIVTNLYDVTQGRQGGGALNVVTRSGTNEFHGSVFAYNRNASLTTEDFTGRPPSEFVLTQWGSSFSGPLVRDKAHFFVAFDRQDQSEPYYIADIRSDQDAIDLRINADSLSRLMSVLQTHYGLGEDRQVGEFNRKSVANTLFGRVDWQINPRHRLALRNNFNNWNNPQSGNGDQRITLYESRYSFESRNNSTLLSLTSSLPSGTLNELKLQFSQGTMNFIPNSDLPRGWVRIKSDLPNGTTGNTRVQFGGHRYGFENNLERQLQLINTTRMDLGGQHVTFGTDNTLTNINTYLGIEHGGLFEFESLADLEAKRAFRYSRQVPVRSPKPINEQYVLDGGLFAQTEFQALPRLDVTAGLRWDVTSFLTTPDRNPVVERTLGLRTDRAATDWNNLQPRLQLTWDTRGDGTEIVKLGAGAFSAQPPYYSHINHLLNNGLELADVVLTGTAVPTPDFRAYRDDPLAVPGVSAGAVTGPSYINLMSEGFETPTAWKANLSWHRLFRDALTLGANLMVSRTVDNYQYFDRNLVEEPYFTIEGGRGVFVPASTIDTRGRTNNRDARITPELGRVLELVPGGELRQRAMVLEAGLRLPRESSLNLSYTWNKTEDNSSYNCCVARTSTFTPIKSDPRDLSGSWGASDYDFRHKVVAYGMLPALYGFRLSGRYIGTTGAPFSLTVNGDVNGDDIGFNDLAFAFDPDDPSTPKDIAASMRKVLDNPDNLAADYIRESLGGIANRNGGYSPWRGTIDLRLSREFQFVGGHPTELIVDVFNFSNLLNDDWGGEYNLGSRQTLLDVTGFDPATRRYSYSVNENVGLARKTGDPYRIQIGVRQAF